MLEFKVMKIMKIISIIIIITIMLINVNNGNDKRMIIMMIIIRITITITIINANDNDSHHTDINTNNNKKKNIKIKNPTNIPTCCKTVPSPFRSLKRRRQKTIFFPSLIISFVHDRDKPREIPANAQLAMTIVNHND